jgi:hypothetical protein
MAALSGDWIEKQPSSNQMHPRRRAVFPSLGSMARDQVTTLWTAYVFNPELRAQFQPHRETKKEVAKPGKHVL